MSLGGHIRAEVAFAANVNTQQMDGDPWLTLDDGVQGRLDEGNVLPGAVWVDLTGWMWGTAGVTLSRGRSRELDEFQAGTASFVLNDPDRLFDPTNLYSPFAGQVRPMRRVRLTAVTGAGQVRLFSGFVADWQRRFERGGFPRVTVRCVDVFERFNMADLPEEGSPVGAGETSGDRVERVLDAVGFGADRDIDVGLSSLAGTTFGGSALQALQAVAGSELGWLFAGRDGTVTFRDRHSVITSEPTIVFGDRFVDPYLDGYTAEYPGVEQFGVQFHDVELASSSDRLFNRVVVVPDSGDEQVAEASGSQAEFGTRTLRRQVLLDSDDEALDQATYLLGVYSAPEDRFSDLTVKLHDGRLDGQDRARVLRVDVGDRITVNVTLQGQTLSRDCVVERVEHRRDSQGWLARFGLSAADTTAYLRLDDDVLGRLDAVRLAY